LGGFVEELVGVGLAEDEEGDGAGGVGDAGRGVDVGVLAEAEVGLGGDGKAGDFGGKGSRAVLMRQSESRERRRWGR